MSGQSTETWATRWLAQRALQARAIDTATFDFIDECPERAEECPEFTAWLAGGN